MKNMKLKDILTPTIALFAICLVATTLLALTNSVTKDKIAQIAIDTEMSSRTLVLPEGKEFSETKTSENGVVYCEGKDENGEAVGYVFTTGAKGYGGTVGVMVGINAEGVITGVEIISHSETPGLGANAVKPEFKERFNGKSGTLTVDKNSNEGQSIQAITAATITSKAVTNAVNSAVDCFGEITGGGNNG